MKFLGKNFGTARRCASLQIIIIIFLIRILGVRKNDFFIKNKISVKSFSNHFFPAHALKSLYRGLQVM